MVRANPSPGRRLLHLWRFLSPVPGGRWIFSRLLGLMVPYSATVRPRVETLRPGYARIRMNDRRRVRNHLDSIHAVALLNLGELTGGLATLTALSPDVRGIVLGLECDYLRKARGEVIAECRSNPPPPEGQIDLPITTEIRDATDEPVARVRAVWRLDRRGGPNTVEETKEGG